MKFLDIVPVVLGLGSTAMAAPAEVLENRSKVTVSFPGGSVVGRSVLGTETFAGIPYAEPPVGDLRLRAPKRLGSKLNNYDATGLSPACPQMFVSNEARDLIGKVLGTLLKLPLLDQLDGKEDCLTVTVQRPAGVKAGDKLPVLFWIFGGAFELGATNTYDASSLFSTANSQGQPFVFVSVNYRLNGFGFLPGKEVLKDGATNLGLRDQRMGLEWVADNIDAFGGDPDKVTIWGESAGSISVFDQMLYKGGDASYKGKPLFRGSIMNSGSAVPADPVDCPKGQAIYDQVVNRAGCDGASDTLDCLRKAPYDKFYNAVTSVPGALSYNSVALSYLPRPDGDVLPESPEILGKQGRFYAVPSIIGDQEDEGTLFSLLQTNVSSTEDLTNYLKDLYFANASKDQIRTFVEMYPEDISAGSPFRTSIFNEWNAGFKRRAALLGDIVFTLTRRVTLDFVNKMKPDMPTWSYLSSYDYGTPVMGTFHASDILQVFYGILPNHAMASCRTYYFNFLYNLDPNKGVGGYDNWPRWGDAKKLMWFKSATRNALLDDNFRQEASDFLAANAEILHI